MEKYSAKFLFNEFIGTFICPSCKMKFNAKPHSYVVKKIVKVSCINCEYTLDLELPNLNKTLIYIDQWFISNLFDDELSEKYTKLFKKIELLVHLQRVLVIISDIHANETSYIPDTLKKSVVWKSFMSLSKGTICISKSFTNQYIDLVSDGKEHLSWKDILYNDPNSWTLPTTLSNGSKVNLYSSGDVYISLADNMKSSYQSQNERMRKLLNEQCDEVALNSTYEDCYAYINQAWTNEFKLGIEFYEKVHYPQSIYDISDLSKYTYVIGYSHQIDEIIKGIGNSKLSGREALKKLSERIGDSVSDRLSLTMEANNLYKAISTLKNCNSITENQKKFSRKYGVSRYNDISHIAEYIPYVDIFLTDNEVKKEFSSSPLKEHISHLGCSVYSSKNINQLNNYLDDLLNDETESESVKYTRRLLVGMSQKESDKHIKHALQEAMAEILTRLKK